VTYSAVTSQWLNQLPNRLRLRTRIDYQPTSCCIFLPWNKKVVH